MTRQKEVFKSKLVPVAAVAAVIVLIAAAMLLSLPIRYSRAEAMLERGEYDGARQVFEALGDYKDAAAQVEEAEKGLVYLDAQALLEQGKYREALERYGTISEFENTQDKILETKYLLAVELLEQEERREARAILEEIGSFRDAEMLLEQLKREMAYDQAAAYMTNENYTEAAEQFRALGEFRDAAEKAEECQRLGEVKAAYEEGHSQFKDGKWLEAYRTLSSIREAAYEDTVSILEEIAAVTQERTRFYAGQGKRGKLLAFLRLAEEIDEESGRALRQELAPAETFEPDLSFFQFDPECLTSCRTGTTSQEYVATLLHMILSGETQLTLTSASELDKAIALGRFYDAQNILGEIIPGCGAFYDIDVSVQGNSMEITMERVEGYRELMDTYETFCEESVRELVESGLLSSSMSRKDKAEIISEWVCFYLTYDEMLEVQNAGIAVEQAKGVCTAYTTLYHRMCNLAGVPTYGQRGAAGERHIWVVHVDESGNIFYADPTWADNWDDDFTQNEEKPTVAAFVEKYLERCMEGAVREYRYANYNDEAGRSGRKYLWARSLWSSHEADRGAEHIIALYQKLLGKIS